MQKVRTAYLQETNSKSDEASNDEVILENVHERSYAAAGVDNLFCVGLLQKHADKTSVNLVVVSLPPRTLGLTFLCPNFDLLNYTQQQYLRDHIFVIAGRFPITLIKSFIYLSLLVILINYINKIIYQCCLLLTRFVILLLL